MPRGRRGRLLAGLGIVLGVSAAVGGCQTLPPTAAVAPAPTVRMAGPDPARPDPATVVLGPQTLVQWSAESTKDPTTAPVQGKAVVGPDGKVDLGPYGSVAVGGLTAQQA